ncbi:hypothetical protein OSB04_002868 [Centaurea solstitialis]|uniref:Uncharacterized protein n=1 Tax=Centaurea solstitialis TaxID=347529 RepID=A0AA38WN71_9ASTR|nr:hypothetical protein OSB04_002868 [Centaurea solstitialis]
MDYNGNPIVSVVMTSSTVVTTIPIVSSNAPVISSGWLRVIPMNHTEKPEKFAVPEGQSDIHVISIVEAWKHSDFLCSNYVFNGLVDALYNVYSASNTSKELWQSLEKKYKTEDVGSKKFVVARFLEFKMTDSKNVISQVQELQVMLYDIHAEGMIVSETFQAWLEEDNKLAQKKGYGSNSMKANVVEHGQA